MYVLNIANLLHAVYDCIVLGGKMIVLTNQLLELQNIPFPVMPYTEEQQTLSKFCC